MTFPSLNFPFIIVQYRVYEQKKCYEIWYLQYLLECKYKYGLKLKRLQMSEYRRSKFINFLGNSKSYEKQVDIGNKF